MLLLILTWLAVASAFRYFLPPPSAVGRETVTMLAVFVAFAAIVTLMVRAAPNSHIELPTYLFSGRPLRETSSLPPPRKAS